MRVEVGPFNLRRNIVSAIVAFAINVGLVFLSYRLVIRQGGLEALGLWSVLFAWTSMIRIGDAGMANAAVRFIALCDQVSEGARLRAYLETGVIANIALFSALGMLGYMLISSSLESLVEARFVDDAKAVLPIMIVSFVLLNISGVLMGSLQGLHLGYVSYQLAVVGNLLQIAAVALLVPRLGIAGLACAQVLQHGLTATVAWGVIRRRAEVTAWVPLGFSGAAFREMLSFSLKAQVANIANGLFEPISKILVGHFGSLQVLGTYELAFKTVALARNLVASALSASLPAMTSLFATKINDAYALYRLSSRRNFIFTVALLSVVLLCSPLISAVWLGQINTTFIGFVVVICMGFTLNAYGAPAYLLGTAAGRMQNNILTATLAVVLLATFGSAFGYLYGGSGVVVATSLCLGICGWLIKVMNEKLFFARFLTAAR